MKSTDFYRQILGLESPWSVSKVDYLASKAAADAKRVPETPDAAGSASTARSKFKDLIPLDHSDPEQLRVDAGELHRFLEVGKDFSTWIKYRIKSAGFVEGEDFSAFESLSSPESGSSKSRPQKTVEYSLTMDMAKELSLLERNEKGRQARRYFIASEKRLRQGPPALRIPQTYSDALRALADTTDSNQKLVAENSHLFARLGFASEEVAQAKEGEDRAKAHAMSALKREEIARQQAEAAKADAISPANAQAREDKAELLTVFLARMKQRLGHGKYVGGKMMRALGLMHRQFVGECRHDTEPAICDDMILKGVMFYGRSEFLKTKIYVKGQPAEPVLDSHGKQIVGVSHPVLVDADIGIPWLTNWFMTRPECVLRRMVMQHRENPVIRRLKGRYSFQECDKHAWDELFPEVRVKGVRLIREVGGS